MKPTNFNKLLMKPIKRDSSERMHVEVDMISMFMCTLVLELISAERNQLLLKA